MEENTVCNIMDLPEEIILKILSYSEIDCKSLLNFGETCKKFHILSADSILWKKQLKVRYPNIFECILLHGSDDYFEQYQYVKNMENKIIQELKDMSPRFFWHNKEFQMEDAEMFFKMCGERNISLFCVHSLLVDIHIKSGQVIESDYPSTSPYTLTVQYYATFVIRYVIHIFLMMVWRSMTINLDEISPERVLNFYVNWTDTLVYTDFAAVKEQLDVLTKEVEEALPARHPLRAIDEETRAEWEEGPLADNQWAPADSHAVHSAIRHVIYSKRGLKVERSLTRKCLHLPFVVKRKKGHVIALSVLYCALARRCGVKCSIIAFPEHFFLEWREIYSQSSPRYNINVETGKLEKKAMCPYAISVPSGNYRDYNPESLLSALTEEVRRMFEFERNTTLRLHVEGLEEILHGVEGQRYLSKFTSLIGAEPLTQLMLDRPHFIFDNLDEDYRSLLVEFAVPSDGVPVDYGKPRRTVYRNRRSTQVHFAVGMVCVHRMYNYTCVVTGWDAACAAPVEWQARMGVNSLEYKAQQPFYNVYATDGTSRYVAQENLNLLIGHRQRVIEDVIGKEFSHFNGTYYIPNAEKQKEYPDEKQVIAAYRRVPTMLMSSCKLLKPIPGNMQVFNWR